MLKFMLLCLILLDKFSNFIYEQLWYCFKL